MISAVILTKNEENNIVDCLESVLWCDEIIIIDDFSEDHTLEAVKTLNAPKIKIFQHKLGNNFSAQRNYGLSKAKGEWVLFVDADERLSNGLAGEIKDILESGSSFGGYYVRRIDYMWGRKLSYGETRNIKLLRFAKKNSGYWKGTVHEVWDVKAKTTELRMPLLHYPHKDIEEFLSEINYYTDLRARELFYDKVTVSRWQIIAYPLGKFMLNYFLKAGFGDGVEGLVSAIMMSFHSFLVRAKLWTLWQKK